MRSGKNTHRLAAGELELLACYKMVDRLFTIIDDICTNNTARQLFLGIPHRRRFSANQTI